MEWTGKLHKRHFWHVSKIPNCLYLDEVGDEDEDDNEDFIDNEDLDYEKKNVQLWSLFFGHQHVYEMSEVVWIKNQLIFLIGKKISESGQIDHFLFRPSNPLARIKRTSAIDAWSNVWFN